MKQFLFAIGVVFALFTSTSCTKTATQSKEEKTMAKQEMHTASDSDAIDDWLARFRDAFNRKDARSISSMYSSDATWTMANGAELKSADLNSALSKAFDSGAGNLTTDNVREVNVGAGKIIRHDFSFSIGEVSISGVRTIWRSPNGIERDLWVPSSTADADTMRAAQRATQSLDAWYNASTATTSPYEETATVLLTNGALFRGADATKFVAAAVPSISQMRQSIDSVYAVGSAHVATESTFSATMSTDSGQVPLAGRRLTLWSTSQTPWKVVSELSWPEKK